MNRDILKNEFKCLLEKGMVSYGIWNGIPNTYVAEILAGSGFDWVLVDAEHGPFDFKSILLQVQVLSGYSVPVLVRPPVGDSVLIKQLLDIGVQNLLIPMVETPEQARALVQAMRYPPHGIRGVGTALARASRWNQIDNYINRANEQMCLIVQVESAKGLDQLEAICQVEGVDGVFIGPSDLAASIGYLGKPTHPDMLHKIGEALALIHKCGKTAGVLALETAIANHYIAKGARMIGVGADTLMLAQSAQAIAQRFKSSSV